MNNRTRLIILVSAIALLALAVWQFPVAEWLTGLVRWIEANRNIAWIVFIGAYVAATVLMIPGSILTVAAGYVFGVLYGTALVSVASTLGATAAFLVGRYLGRGWVREKIGTDSRLGAIDRATKERGFLVMLLLRSSPLFPFNALNYLMSLTGMSLRNFFFGSWLGMLPGTLLYVFIGSAAGDLTALLAGEYEAGLAGRIFFVGGLIATVIVTVLIARYAARTLRSQIGIDTDEDVKLQETG